MTLEGGSWSWPGRAPRGFGEPFEAAGSSDSRGRETEQAPAVGIFVYRSMKADGECPALGGSHTCLGVIVEGPRREIEVDDEGYVSLGLMECRLPPAIL